MSLSEQFERNEKEFMDLPEWIQETSTEYQEGQRALMDHKGPFIDKDGKY